MPRPKDAETCAYECFLGLGNASNVFECFLVGGFECSGRLWIRLLILLWDIVLLQFAPLSGGPVEELPGFLHQGFHDVWFGCVMNFSLHLSPYLGLRHSFVSFGVHVGCPFGRLWASK